MPTLFLENPVAVERYTVHRFFGLCVDISFELDNIRTPADFERAKKQIHEINRGLYRKAIKREEDFVRFDRMTVGEAEYASITSDDRFVSGVNPTITISACNLAEIDSDEWMGAVEYFVDALGEQFHRLRVSSTQKEIKTYQRI